jgi:transcriptional regulator of NAD metabolism
MEATESAFGFLEDINPIRKLSKWSQDTFGNDPTFNQGKTSDYIASGKGRVTEGQIEDGIARIQSLFKEISISSNPKLSNPNLDSFNEEQRKLREKRGANKPILPAQPDTPEGPSAAQQAKAEELRLAQEAYRLEAEIVRARIAGDDKKLADLERQKAIEEEILTLKKLGMTGDKAKDTAAKMVDAHTAADEADKAEELRLAQEAYRLEAEMVRARIAGDDAEIARLERKKAIEEEIVTLKKLGMTGDKAKDTAAKMVDARAAADEVDKAREKKQHPGPSAGVSQLGSVAKATNVLMGRAANDGILQENRRQTSLLRSIKENTKPKKTNPEVQIPVFA